MMRVLHLLGKESDLQTRHSLRTLREGAFGSCELTIQTIGRGGTYPNMLRAALALRRQRFVDQFNLVHAWDESSVTAASLAGAKEIVFAVPAEFFGKVGTKPPGLLSRHSRIRLVCSNPDQHRRCLAAGMPPQQCHLIRPPAELGADPESTRASMRQALGIGHDHFVVLMAGESTRAAAHELGVWAASILHVVDERYRVILWGRGPRLDAAADLGDKLRQPGLVVVAERLLGRAVDFSDLLPAADAMLVTASAPIPTLPIALAMARGLPIVSVERPELRDILIDNETAFTVTPAGAHPLAQRALDLRGDPSQTTAVAGQARERAIELFSPSTFVDAYRLLYRTAAHVHHDGSLL
jgi:glycosyltransferase involved in cell wall biosynthesis